MHKPIGVLGGTFDPIHNGHLLPALEAAKQFGLSQIALMPLNVAVHRPQPQASSAQRIAMCEQAAQQYPTFVVDTREIDRGGESYTVDTLEQMRAEMDAEQPLCWLMGQDSYQSFATWNGWQRILELAHLIVMERPPISDTAKQEQSLHNLQEHPAELQPYHADSLLEGGKKWLPAGRIVFAQVTPQSISSTEIRKKLAAGAQCERELPQNVRKYIQQHQLYTNTAKRGHTHRMTTDELKKLVLEALDDLKVVEVVQLDVSEKTTMTDCMMIATGTSSRHVKSLASNVVIKCKEQGVQPLGVEGERDGEWVLVDLGDVLLHVMQPQVRDYYNIEKLWEMDARPDNMDSTL